MMQSDNNHFINEKLAEYRSMIMGFILTQIPEVETAEDIFQDVSLTIYQKIDSFDRSTNFKAWAMKITRFKVLTYFKKNQIEKKNIRFSSNLIDKMVELSDWSEHKDFFESEKIALRNCLKKIDSKGRQMLLKRYAEKKSMQEIANDHALTKNSLYVIMFRLRTKLESCIKKTISMDSKQVI